MANKEDTWKLNCVTILTRHNLINNLNTLKLIAPFGTTILFFIEFAKVASEVVIIGMKNKFILYA